MKKPPTLPADADEPPRRRAKEQTPKSESAADLDATPTSTIPLP